MEIKVLGPGCAKCKTTYNVIEKVIKENNLDVKLTKVDDIMEMVSYNTSSPHVPMVFCMPNMLEPSFRISTTPSNVYERIRPSV